MKTHTRCLRAGDMPFGRPRGLNLHARHTRQPTSAPKRQRRPAHWVSERATLCFTPAVTKFCWISVYRSGQAVGERWGAKDNHDKRAKERTELDCSKPLHSHLLSPNATAASESGKSRSRPQSKIPLRNSPTPVACSIAPGHIVVKRGEEVRGEHPALSRRFVRTPDDHHIEGI